MPESVVAAAPWLAVAIAIAAVVAVSWTAYGAWLRWRELRVVQRAAAALVDAHVERLDESVRQASRATGELADGGDQLAASLVELRADLTHLRWLGTRVGDEREDLVRALAEIVLPTSRRSSGDDG